ncbi:nitroreductase family protein [Plasticicumulans sp.]|uniref:nitroreductase family protein n=1 Tax=Plasticicumulans sp. TaxID=2307179 RepID=UPI00394B7489
MSDPKLYSLPDKPAVTAAAIDAAIARRWSPRALDPARPLARAHLQALLEAARWAPSCFGDQPWRFVCWDRSRDPAGFAAALATLSEGNRVWAQHAAVLLLAVACTDFRHNQQPNRWAQYDTGAASENLCLQAAALGLAAHQMGGFDVAAIAALAGLPERATPMAMIAVAHPAAADALPEALRSRETAARTRLALPEIAFEGGWAQPLGD